MSTSLSGSSSDTFYKELVVPMRASGVVRGKRGTTIKTFQQTPGISSVILLPGKVEIRGSSEEAVQSVAASIEQLVSFGIDKSINFFPDFFILCFCLSVEKPLLAVSEVCFEKFPSEICNIYEAKQERRTYFCFRLGKPRDDFLGESDENPNFDVNNLSVDFCHSFSLTDIMLFPLWNYSAYKSTLISCLEPLLSLQHETARSIKLAVRFGKQLFHGVGWDRLQNGGFMSLPYLHDLCSRNRLKQRFSTSCTETAVTNLRLHHLESLGYVKVSSRNKISLHVADLKSGCHQFNVSIRCGSRAEWLHNREIQRISRAKDYFQVLGVDAGASEDELKRAYRRCCIRIQSDHDKVSTSPDGDGAIKAVEEAYECLMDPPKRHNYLMNFTRPISSSPPENENYSGDDKAVVTRIRNQRKRYGFVAFMRQGPATTDFRLGVTTHGTHVPMCQDMVGWIEEGWRNRTSDGLLSLAAPGRFQVLHVRYKETETFMTEHWKFRIATVRDGYRNCVNTTGRLECALSSRWFKRNAVITDDMEVVMENVGALIEESAKLSGLMT